MMTLINAENLLLYPNRHSFFFGPFTSKHLLHPCIRIHPLSAFKWVRGIIEVLDLEPPNDRPCK